MERNFLCRFYVYVPDYNSLSNLNTLRGLRGAYPRVGVLGNPLAWYSLSMRKLCLESYPLETCDEHNCLCTMFDYSTLNKNDVLTIIVITVALY